MNLEKLIKDCKKHKPKAQKQLYERYKDDLYFSCLKYCKNKEDAEDNLQDAFITIFRQIKKYKGTGSFEAWMKRIAINKAIDKYRKQKPFLIREYKEMNEEQQIEDKYLDIELDIILKHVQDLPNQYRMVFSLYQLDDYSHKEIATMLNITEGTSKSNLHRAKAILKNKLKELDDSFYDNKLGNGN